MGNCLKTQLKQEVNNDNLVTMDELRLRIEKVAGAGASKFNIRNVTDSWHVTVTGSGRIALSEADLTNNPQTSLYFTDNTQKTIWVNNEDCYIKISNKTTLYSLGGRVNSQGSNYVGSPMVNIEDIQYIKTMGSLDYINGNISLLSDFIQLGTITLGTHNTGNPESLPNTIATYYGDLSDIKCTTQQFSGMTQLVRLTLGSNVSGDISYFGTIINIPTLDLRITQVSGTIESYIDALTTAGKQSGNIEVRSNPQITYQGNTIPYHAIITFTNGTASVLVE